MWRRMRRSINNNTRVFRPKPMGGWLFVVCFFFHFSYIYIYTGMISGEPRNNSQSRVAIWSSSHISVYSTCLSLFSESFCLWFSYFVSVAVWSDLYIHYMQISLSRIYMKTQQQLKSQCAWWTFARIPIRIELVLGCHIIIMNIIQKNILEYYYVLLYDRDIIPFSSSKQVHGRTRTCNRIIR